MPVRSGRRPALPARGLPARTAGAGEAPAPLPDGVPGLEGPTSGGSTGRPKLIVSGERSLLDPDGTIPLRLQPDGCLVMPGPLYHNGPIVWSCQALLWGNHVAVLPRFDSEATLAAIEAHRAETVYLVPTMMKRIWRLPEAVQEPLRPRLAPHRVAPGRAVPGVAEGAGSTGSGRTASSSSTPGPRPRWPPSSVGRSGWSTGSRSAAVAGES